MGRPKSKIGRKHKNYEKIRQSMKKNIVGRPRKTKNVVRKLYSYIFILLTSMHDQFIGQTSIFGRFKATSTGF